MPSKTASKGAGTANRGNTGNFVDDYLADWDDDPFRSVSPEPAKNDKDGEGEKKKDILGIDKELDLKKKPRAPRVKLDETRLLSDKGIPKLRKMAPRLKLKGKGHEFSDAARLLSFYQEWLDDLFPKATFLDALAMVEKTGHKTTMRSARQKWIDELKPRAAIEEDEEDNRIHRGAVGPQQPPKVAPIFETTAKAAAERAKTPTADDLFGDDLYNATPVRNTGSTAPPRQVGGDVPDDDDLDALMAEAEAEARAQTQRPGPAPSSGSIFGNGARAVAPTTTAGPDDDDLDALMAEAEAQSLPTRPAQPVVNESIFGNGAKKQTTQVTRDEDDDLDALMAEAEAETGVGAAGGSSGDKKTSAQAETGHRTGGFDDGEEAMAEMDGLW
ncbi:chromosome segregation in meiosis protein 3 [Chaetomium tenue]|uniref:Chromosome segregation in meiosis protein 3 n=1 Tax=Chaetomium tenue TaxID=1854479 RepID=A0ACB7P483_9PEZI|nr:chromosome segregation in meiosis protein 3 [Chaetomium globosum]